MKKLSYLLLTLMSCTLTAMSQDNMYAVYSLKGNVSIVENKVEIKAKVGTLLDGNETIKIGPGSFATLICNETRMFSLSKAGTYSAASLSDSCKMSNGSVSANYMKYVWNEMTKSKGSPEKNRKNYMANVGAVSRSINNVWIDPKLDTLNYVSGTIPLSWKSYTDAEEFEFKLYDDGNNGREIISKTIKKKHIDISDLLDKIQPGKTYHWSAMIKGEENEERKFLAYMTKEKYAEYFNSIKNGEASESESEKEFRLGFILEENHFIVEAYNHYLKATQLAPANTLYRSVFMSFKKDFEIK
ncbi:MAG: hypothetical protein ABUT20_09200 [Bacteroidota bacterium]